MLAEIGAYQRCPYCSGINFRLHGFSKAKIQRYFCLGCSRTFQKKYIYLKNELKTTTSSLKS
ncbi:transposase [Leminorella richardii]|uniref:transposase n=1 Tax=Leminorella richardii TaxID=158841 RepID=UPI0039E9FA41